MLAMLIVLGAYVAPRLVIDTDILALLPSSRDAAVDNALIKLSATMSQRQLFLIGARDLDIAKQAARDFAGKLSASGEFAKVQFELSSDLRAVTQGYREHAAYLLADADRARLAAGAGESLYQDALRAAYTPAGMMRILSLADDPLGVLGNFLQQQVPSIGQARLDGSMLIVEREDGYYVLVTAETTGSAFSADVQQSVLPVIAAAMQAAHSNPDVQILTSGALQHAAAATTQAKSEIAKFGSIETLAVLALLFFVFGNIRPLLLAAAVLGLSAAGAIVASHFLFGKLHIMALVFGASLIGVVIDYSMHFFADRFRLRDSWTPASAVAHVGPAILLGMSVTLVGYLGLVLMPFPGLRQIAAFCMIGIVIGCGSVLCLYPLLMSTRLLGGGSLPDRGPRIAGVLDRALAGWRWTPAKLFICFALGAVVLGGIWRADVQDDIRALQSSPPELLANEQRVQTLLGGGVETRFFLIQGDDAQSLLENEEVLREHLDGLVREGVLNSYLALTRALPSKRRQTADHELMERGLFQQAGPFARILTQFGFPKAQIDARLQAIRVADRPFEVEAWLESPGAGPYRHMWLDKIGERYASVVTLSGIRDVEKLRSATESVANVRLIDRPRDISSVMQTYRHATGWLLLFANATALLVLGFRFGWREGARMVLPSAAACLATLGVFGWLGIGINLFTVFALLLVLALGVDYGIFLRHGQNARITAILSVSLSACTTFIGFGMLAFSATPFIRSIGLTLLCGIAFSWAFVMLSCMTYGKKSMKQTGEAT